MPGGVSDVLGAAVDVHAEVPLDGSEDIALLGEVLHGLWRASIDLHVFMADDELRLRGGCFEKVFHDVVGHLAQAEGHWEYMVIRTHDQHISEAVEGLNREAGATGGCLLIGFNLADTLILEGTEWTDPFP